MPIPRGKIQEAARDFLELGYSVMPCRVDKKPAIAKWQAYQSTQAPLSLFLPHHQAIALIGGFNGVEIFDIDRDKEGRCPFAYETRDVLKLWLTEISRLIEESDLSPLESLRHLYVQATQSGGYHVIVKWDLSGGGAVGRNSKIFSVKAKDVGFHAIIETRGAGGYALIAPSVGYNPIKGNLTALQPIPFVYRALFHRAVSAVAAGYEAINDAKEHIEQDAVKNYEAKQAKVNPDAKNVIGIFNQRYPLDEMLARYGYIRKGEHLWLFRGSTSGLAGVKIFDDAIAYSHHSGDPISDGHAHDAFDLYAIYEFLGDKRAAYASARDELHCTAADENLKRIQGKATKNG